MARRTPPRDAKRRHPLTWMYLGEQPYIPRIRLDAVATTSDGFLVLYGAIENPVRKETPYAVRIYAPDRRLVFYCTVRTMAEAKAFARDEIRRERREPSA